MVEILQSYCHLNASMYCNFILDILQKMNDEEFKEIPIVMFSEERAMGIITMSSKISLQRNGEDIDVYCCGGFPFQIRIK